MTKFSLLLAAMKEFEDVISRIQTSIPNFTANYRCDVCLSSGGLPTEEEIETKRKERIKKRLADEVCSGPIGPLFYFGDLALSTLS